MKLTQKLRTTASYRPLHGLPDAVRDACNRFTLLSDLLNEAADEIDRLSKELEEERARSLRRRRWLFF